MQRESHSKIRTTLVSFSFIACALAVLTFGQAWAATKIPVSLDIDATGLGAEEFGHHIEKYIRSSDFYVLGKKRVPRVGIIVNAITGKGDAKLVTYSIILTVTTGKCPESYIGTIFGDNSNEEPKELHDKLEKAIMTIAKEFNL